MIAGLRVISCPSLRVNACACVCPRAIVQLRVYVSTQGGMLGKMRGQSNELLGRRAKLVGAKLVAETEPLMSVSCSSTSSAPSIAISNLGWRSKSESVKSWSTINCLDWKDVGTHIIPERESKACTS